MEMFTTLIIEAPGRAIVTHLDRPMSIMELWRLVKLHGNRPLPILYQSGDTARVTYHSAIRNESLGVSGGRGVA